MQHKVGARWRISPVRSDDGQHVGFGVFQTDDGGSDRPVVPPSESWARATHVAHALEAFDAGDLARFSPYRLFVTRAQYGRLQ